MLNNFIEITLLLFLKIKKRPDLYDTRVEIIFKIDSNLRE